MSLKQGILVRSYTSQQRKKTTKIVLDGIIIKNDKKKKEKKKTLTRTPHEINNTALVLLFNVLYKVSLI